MGRPACVGQEWGNSETGVILHFPHFPLSPFMTCFIVFGKRDEVLLSVAAQRRKANSQKPSTY
jgi:hypothetical protein